MESGCVVEFIDNQKISCGVVLEIKKLRLRLLTENNREIKLSAGRLLHRSDLRLDTSQSRERIAEALRRIAAQRRALSEQVDIKGLWEVLNGENTWVDLATMTALCFPGQADDAHESAVIRAFFDDRLYFKFNADRFLPHTPEQLGRIIAQREADERRAKQIDQGGLWLQRILKQKNTTAPEEKEAILEILSSYYLFEKESPHRTAARAMLKKAGLNGPSAIFTFMVKVGAWSTHINLDLLRFQIDGEHPAQVREASETICAKPPALDQQRRDLTHLPVLTIDGPSTQDFDDALSIEQHGDHFLVGIHITDVAHFIARNSTVDREALSRASSIYMPDGKIPMLPSCLSDDICSLKAGQVRPAISTLVRISGDGAVLDSEIVPSLINVRRQLTYQDVEAMEEDEAIAGLYRIARGYRNRRLQQGALLIKLPEIAVWLNNGDEPQMARTDRESMGRMLVSEMMILANELTAAMLVDHHLPAIFRSQQEPRERLFTMDTGTLFQNWMQRKQINRFVLGSAPERHAGLGLPAYVTCTSPIRKYFDLTTQRQVRTALGLEKPYTREEIDFLIASLEEPMGRVGRVQQRRHRYWLFKCLEKCIGSKEEALVLGRRREGYAILLPKYMIECLLSGADNIKMKPEDLVQVTLQHVNARNDVISVYLG